MKQFVKDLVHSYEEPLKEIRHHLHENPELSFEEYRTAEYIRKALGSMGIALQDGITGTSTVGILKGREGWSLHRLPGRYRRSSCGRKQRSPL